MRRVTLPHGSSGFAGELFINSASPLESFDRSFHVRSIGETGAGPQPLNRVVQVSDVVLRIVPIADRLIVVRDVDRRRVRENSFRPSCSIEAADLCSVRAVYLREVESAVALQVFIGPRRDPATSTRGMLQVNLRFVTLATRS